MNYVVDEVFLHAREYLNKLCQLSADETISKTLAEKDLDYLRKDLIDYYVSSYFAANENENLENSFVICGKFEKNPASLEFYILCVKNIETEVYHCMIFTKKDAEESDISDLKDIVRNFHNNIN
jgi:hypothetical protein